MRPEFQNMHLGVPCVDPERIRYRELAQEYNDRTDAFDAKELEETARREGLHDAKKFHQSSRGQKASALAPTGGEGIIE